MKQYQDQPSVATIVGYRPDLLDGPPACPGSTRLSCAECHCYVWLTPSTCEVLAKHPTARVLCLLCAAPIIGADSDAELLRPSDEAIRRDLRLSEAEVEELARGLSDLPELLELCREAKLNPSLNTRRNKSQKKEN